MDRSILHVDCNKFYASVECLHRPEIRNKPVVVGGDPEQRHGIVLTKNEIAAKYNIKTGEAIWQARNKCRDLVVVPPNFPLYMRFSKLVREIFADYTDKIEPFGLDECWLDVTGSSAMYGDALKIAQCIRKRVKFELGITVSVGISYNKIFAKLGSDYKKPDAITAITRQNYKRIAWGLPASDLLYVGRATAPKLKNIGIETIGDLANADPVMLKNRLGKIGLMLHTFANGEDKSEVSDVGAENMIKSIGNSFTTPRDIKNRDDAKMLIYVLCESVARRLRDNGLCCRVISISVRDTELYSFTRQKKLNMPTDITKEIADTAYELFCENYDFECNVRSIGVSASDFCSDSKNLQLSLFCDNEKRESLSRIDKTVDTLKRRYGNYCIQRGVVLKDEKLTRFNPHDDHIIHPVGFLNGKINSGA